MTLRLVNEKGVLKEVPTGFSWTMLFFGCFVPIFRGDVKWFLITLGLGFVTFGTSWLVFPFLYNKIYLKGLLEKGFKASDQTTADYLVGNSYVVRGNIETFN